MEYRQKLKFACDNGEVERKSCHFAVFASSKQQTPAARKSTLRTSCTEFALRSNRDGNALQRVAHRLIALHRRLPLSLSFSGTKYARAAEDRRRRAAEANAEQDD